MFDYYRNLDIGRDGCKWMDSTLIELNIKVNWISVHNITMFGSFFHLNASKSKSRNRDIENERQRESKKEKRDQNGLTYSSWDLKFSYDWSI